MTDKNNNNYIFGHIPGSTPGDFFQSRMELSVARIHGPPQAGIWGRQNEGACSIILSEGYEDDIDELMTVFYTGHGGRDTDGKQITDQEFILGNQALVLNCELDLPVRVSRSYETKYGPSTGYRYDGLYNVVSYERVIGKSGFYICRFRLESHEKLDYFEKITNGVFSRKNTKPKKNLEKKIIKESNSMPDNNDSFDPLHITLDEIEELTKRSLKNIIDSYNGYWDIFSELIQNSMDALFKKFMDERNFKPEIVIEIDLKDSPNQTISVTDNGIGMDEETYKKMFTPHASTKSADGNTKGYKGVGASFIAYGFNNVQIYTKKDKSLSGELNNGNKWIRTIQKSKPLVNSLDPDEISFPFSTGTKIKVDVSNSKPDLSYYNLSTAEVWLRALMVKTPISNVALGKDERLNKEGKNFSPNVTVKFRDRGNTKFNEYSESNLKYPLMHDLISENDQSESAWLSDLIKNVKDRKDQFKSEEKPFSPRTAPDLFQLSSVHELWDNKEFIKELEGTSKINKDTLGKDIINRFSEDESVDKIIDLVKKHQIEVYACFFGSRDKLANVNNSFEGRSNTTIIKPGYQIATENMVQGDPYDIPLTGSAGYKDAMQIIISGKNIPTDVGRKSFPSEINNLAKSISSIIGRELLYMVDHLRFSVTINDEDQKRKHTEKITAIKEEIKDTNSLLSVEKLRYILKPESEQDVVGVFNQLIAFDHIIGYEILRTSSSNTYDAYFLLSHKDYENKENKLLKLIGSHNLTNYRSNAEHKDVLTMEFKYDLQGIEDDIYAEVKDANHIDLIVCYTAKKFKIKNYYRLKENKSKFPHALHVYNFRNRDIPVIILEDFFEKLSID